MESGRSWRGRLTSAGISLLAGARRSIPVFSQPLASDLAFLVGEKTIPFRCENHRLDRQIETLSFPQGHVALRHIRRVEKNSGCLKPAMSVKHLHEPRRVVVAFGQCAL